MAPTYDFPAVSYRDDEGQGKPPPQPGQTWTETVFDWRQDSDPFAKGERSGTVEIGFKPVKGKGPPRLTASFTFDDAPRSTVRLEGEVPGMGSWQGSGRLTFVAGSGTGRFDGRTGSLDVVFQNPKKWG